MSLLVENLKKLRNEVWDLIPNETLVVAKNIGWPTCLEKELKRIRRRKRLIGEENKNPDDNKKTYSGVKFSILF